MKKPVIITLFLLVSSLFVRAQQTQQSHAQPDSIIKMVPIEIGGNTSYIYTIGGKIQTPQDVKIKLLAYAPSADEYHKAKSYAIWGYISTGGFSAASTIAIIEYAHNNKLAGATTGNVNGQAGFIYEHHSLTSAYVFTGVATAFLTSAIINFVNVAKHGKKALKLYNQRYE